jgi:hypothetical protein
MKHLLAALTGLALCTSALAQMGGWVTSPRGGLLNDGATYSSIFGVYADARHQQIDGELTGKAYTIRDVAYRVDHRHHYSTSTMGRSWSQVTLKLAETTAYERMNRTFTLNVTSTQTTVYASKHDWPTVSGLPLVKPGVWGDFSGKLRFPFRTPWVYTGKNDILLEYAFQGGKMANGASWGFIANRLWSWSYYLDSEYVTTGTKSGSGQRVPLKPPVSPCNDPAVPPQYHAYTWGSAHTYGRGESLVTLRNKLLLQHFSYYTAPGLPVVHAIGSAGNTTGVNISARCNKLYVDLSKPAALVHLTGGRHDNRKANSRATRSHRGSAGSGFPDGQRP